MGTPREGSSDPPGNRERVKHNEERIVDTAKTAKRQLSSRKNVDNIFISRNVEITSIPVEILFEILTYLDSRDLYALRKVSKFFQSLALDPLVWTTFEVSNNGPSATHVIGELKRMPHLRSISIEARNDCDDILRQLSCSNKKLQKLIITDCTGTSANLYLRPGYLTKILQRCTKLHTIQIRGSRFRGLKFYRLLGEIGPRLKFVSTLTTRMQFQTFAKHVSNFNTRDREVVSSLARGTRYQWTPFLYCEWEGLGIIHDRPKGTQISYGHKRLIHINNVIPRTVGKTTMVGGSASISPFTTSS